MSNNLSKQLCEVVGIEPRNECEAPAWKQYECPAYHNLDEFKQDCLDCEFAGALNKYPDFENNANNFVKLLELEVKQLGDCDTSVWDLITQEVYDDLDSTHTRQDFLSQLIRYIEQVDDSGVFVKQAISQAEWEY